MRTSSRPLAAGRRHARGREAAQGEEAARVRVPAPLGAGQQKYSYCLSFHGVFTTVYITKLR